jgi:hypothetical protein
MKAILTIVLIFYFMSLKAQTNSDGSAPQFLFPEFATGRVKMKNGYSQTASLNYNIVSEKMVYEKNDLLYDMINLQLIDTVFLQNRRFIPVENVFHEVLLIAPISLFVQHKGEILPPGVPAGYGGTSQVSNTKFMSSVELSMGYYNLKLPKDYTVKADPIYWIRKDKVMNSFMNERQFLKIFPGEQGELKQFIKQNSIKLDRLSDLIRLIEHCNDSVQ